MILTKHPPPASSGVDPNSDTNNWIVLAAQAIQPPPASSVVDPNSDANHWSVLAAQAMRTGEPEAAAQWFQRLLQTDPATLVSTNGTTFRPARMVMAELIRSLPERSLAAFRLRVEAPRTLPGRSRPATDVASLAALYRDELPGLRTADTGLRLAGLYLDQERFRDARRVLIDLLDECPPTGPARQELLARLTVACARVGDTQRAAWAWAEIRKTGDAGRWPELEAEVHTKAAPATPSNEWTMAYGGPLREGTPAGAVPNLDTNETLAMRWAVDLGPGVIRSSRNVDGPTNRPPPFAIDRAYAVARVLEDNRRPADDLVFAGNRAWINGLNDLALIDLDTGRVISRTPHVPVPPQDRGSGTLGTGWPTFAEKWLFNSRMSRAASLHDAHVYCVKDNIYPPHFSRFDLAAYDAATGKLLWRVGRELKKQRNNLVANTIRFLAAPVACSGILVAPIEERNSISVIGLNAETGNPVWRTPIAWRQSFTPPRFVPLTLTMAGSDVYLCLRNQNSCVIRMDACDGSVSWTALFEPSSTQTSTNTADTHAESRNTWEEGLVLVVHDAVVALAEGAQTILAFDRQRGTPLWNLPKPEGVNYVVGLHGSELIVAGERAAACIDLTTGHTRWRVPLAGSTGRGALCGQEALFPNGEAILRLRIADGTARKPILAQTPDNLPLGNLYVQGDQLLVAGLERLYALTPAKLVLARLNESLARNPSTQAFAERARLYASQHRPMEALTDLRQAWKLEPQGTTRKEAVRCELLGALWRTAEKAPHAAEPLHAEAMQVAATPSERTETIWRQAQCREQAGNTNGALELYVAILSSPDVAISPFAGDADWQVFARPLAARRLDAVLAGDVDKRRTLLEAPAAQALQRLGSTPSVTGLVDVATLFPGTTAGNEATRQAAQAATDNNSLGIAEAILYRALTLSPPPDRTAAVDALLQLYVRMKWQEGARRLKAEWPHLFDEAAMPESLERAALAASTAAGTTPLPPWRIRWRKTLEPGLHVRLLNAGLFYFELSMNYGAATKAGCLMIASGSPRWERKLTFEEGYGFQDFVPGLAITPDAYVDAWSGVITAYRPSALPPESFNRPVPQINRTGIAITTIPSDQVPGGLLAGFDVLTGQITWKRPALDTLGGSRYLLPEWFSTRHAFYEVRDAAGGGYHRIAIDLQTGSVTSRTKLEQRNSFLWSSEFMEWADPVLENGRITVRNNRTGTVAWTSPSDLSIAQHSLLDSINPSSSIDLSSSSSFGLRLFSGLIVARTYTNDLILLDGQNGKLLRRREGLPFEFAAVAKVGANNIIAYKSAGNWNPNANETFDEVFVLDTAASNVVFRGFLSNRTTPVLAFGPTLPGQILVWHVPARVPRRGQVHSYTPPRCLQVINERGENPNGWRLPRKGDTADGIYEYFLAEDLILIFNQNTGEVLAYEHDPGDAGKKQEVNER